LVEVTLTLSPPAAELVSGLLFESGALAVAVSEGPPLRLRTCLRDDRTVAGHLRRVKRYLASLRAVGIDPGPAAMRTRRWRDCGWDARWRDFFALLRIGRRLVVKPSWDATVAGEGDIVVELDPGMAFGTGQHPTTRICLELLEEAFERRSADRVRATRTGPARRDARGRPPVVLDLGTGSGLLAIAAARLGAGAVLGLDTDPIACRAAIENIGRNGGDRRVTIRRGSLEAAGRRTFDLILANLAAEQLIELAPRLAASLRFGGRLIASGILTHQEDGVHLAFRRCGLSPVRSRRLRGWVGLVARRDTVAGRASR
jgi:ribosomal protein L11 methyltransferase